MKRSGNPADDADTTMAVSDERVAHGHSMITARMCVRADHRRSDHSAISAADGDVSAEADLAAVARAAVVLLAVVAGSAAVIGRAVLLRQSCLFAADRPGAWALFLQSLLGDVDLFCLAGLVRHSFTAEGLPCLFGELQSAVVSVAGVDVPVTAGFAFGDLVPDALLRCLSQIGRASCRERV